MNDKQKVTEIIEKNPKEENPNIIETNITDVMQKSFLDYAVSVIVSRALPDVRDGLKPVQRRIIYAMQERNMTESGKFYKSATIVGTVIGKYHPHGDTSVYEAMVRMAQDFSLRYPLVFPQGNFGSIDGDPPAAMRYTEAKMKKISEELYKDIGHETVDFEMNDLQNLEPIYLPSALPNVLLNGASGIAVGMATNIPPHNLNEVIDGIEFMVENAETIGSKETKTVKIPVYETEMDVSVIEPDFASKATVEDLIKLIKGPDFPTGGTIYNQKEIMRMYSTGKGRVVTRAKIETEEAKGGKIRIVITEIPYQVNKATLVSKIASLVKDKKISGISDLRDESNRKGMRIVVELKRDAIVKKVQNRLFKYTPLQNTFNTNMVALLDGEPMLMTLKMILEEFVKHRQNIIIKRTLYFLRRAKEREHILQGLKIAIDNIDEVIKLIRASKDVESARKGLMKQIGFTQIQAQAILDMQLRRLAALEREKIENELKEIINTIKDYEALLISPKKIMNTVIKELNEIRDKYGDERKTKVIKGDVNELADEDLIVNEQCIVTLSKSGYIKRMKEGSYRKQGRGGKGVTGQELKEEDIVDTIKQCNTHDWALFFSNKGKVYKLRIWELPETSRKAKGTAIVNFLGMKQSETVESMLVIDKETMEKNEGYIVFGTEKGNIKKTGLDQFENIRTNGIISIKLNADDNLSWVNLSSGDDDIIMTTARGQSIRFHESDVRSMGRTAKGIRGIRLSKQDDKVVGMVVMPKKCRGCTLMTVSQSGYGKKTLVSDYKVQNRGGSGILTYKVTNKTGDLVTSRLFDNTANGDLILATTSGKFIRLAQKDVPKLGRATMGVRLIKLSASDNVTSVAIIEDEEVSDE